MADLPWYRVETDRGRVVSVRLVETAGDDARGVFFVQAIDEAAAKELARLAWNERQRVAQLALRNERASAGQCPRCGGRRDRPGLKTCSKCLEAQSDYDERRRARVKGQSVPPKDRRTTLAINREAAQDEIRLETLRSVHRQYLAAGSDRRSFVDWLLREIHRLAKAKEVA